MQIAACQPVSFCLEYNLRQDEHAVTGNAGAPSIPGSPFRAAGLGTRLPYKRTWSGGNDGCGRSSIQIIVRRS
jgi:hypothetical protein